MCFTDLHHQASPLLLANVWDAASARAAESAGYAAIGTSSAAIAAMLGYADGEEVSFSELHALVLRLRAVTELPLTVDMEAGYGDTAAAVVENLLKLAASGVIGVNLEDSVVIRNGGNDVRNLLDSAVFARRLRDIRAGLQAAGVSLFLNARTDTFLLNVDDARAQTIARGRMYAANGADGLFIPCLVNEADIAAIVAGIPLPVNVMCMPHLPGFSRLAELGVKRISMGNFLYQRGQRILQELYVAVRGEQSFQALVDDAGH